MQQRVILQGRDWLGVCADGAVKEHDMDYDDEEEDEDGCEEKRRAGLKGGFIKGQWTREEDEKVFYSSLCGVSFFPTVSNACE
jgi:hypothetical protein